ncbi:MAG: gamma-glutamyl-gamma-aminobutyrate hydrolase family protein [Anaerolineales bacterium]|nr:gamma-glutamyl-gamma-aminobutyrate hydrolase family protein [Anaerolineales bacterium]
MTIPIIGVTSFRELNKSGNPQFSVGQSYTSSLERAGACPLIIPLELSEAMLDSLLLRLDGMLFTGGGDVHPSAYGSQDHPKVAGVDPDRDRVEIHLLRRVVEAGLPFLGICRGLQLINIALGGTIYEDIFDQRPASLQHSNPDRPRDYLAHSIQVTQDSQIKQILGSDHLEVNSFHHQGIRDLANGLIETAHAPDGVIEAFELPGYDFGLAVQWHPECLQEHPPMRALFSALTQACQVKEHAA